MEKCQTDTYNSSNMQAEYVTCYEATCHAIWLQNFISVLEVVHLISRPLKLFCDNSATCDTNPINLWADL